MQENFLEKNQKVRSTTGFTLDGIGGSVTAGLLAPEGKKLITGVATAIVHQIIHNSIDDCAPDNMIKNIDRMIPVLPTDGIFGTGTAYYFGGGWSAIGFAAFHGPAHMMIEPNQK